MTSLVFVYGTLKQGLPNHYLIEDKQSGICIPRGAAVTMEKYPLIIASEYNIPFMLFKPGRGHNITGELYEVDKIRLEKLDELEAHPKLYERLQIRVRVPSDDGKNDEENTLTAEAYLLVKFRHDLLNFQMMGTYGNHIEGKQYISPNSRGDFSNKWWSEVHTEYDNTNKTVVKS
ncbi:hypothetical protein ACF0H5_011705 [Mactra antiquata]